MKSITAALLVLVFFVGCTDHKTSSPQSVPSFSELPEWKNRAHQTFLLDVDHDGRMEAIVRLQDTTKKSAARDSILYYRFDTASQSYLLKSGIGVDDCVRMDTLTNTANGSSFIILSTNGGGSSRTASCGLVLCQADSNSLHTIFERTSGAPELKASASQYVIYHYDTFAPFFARSEARKLTKTITKRLRSFPATLASALDEFDLESM